MKVFLFPLLASFLFIGCAEKSVQTNLPVPSAGKIERLENFPSQYIPARNVDIWLPEGYNPAEKYAVLYMHDGQMLYDAGTTWNQQEWGVDETISRLIAEQKIMPCIVVGVWNGGSLRHSEYFPQKPFESLPVAFRDSLLHEAKRNGETPLFAAEVYSDLYLKFLTTELKPHIDSTYATYADRANTFIAGSSMGGLISMYAICEYPDIFGGAACLSTHWPGFFVAENNPVPQAFADYMRAHLPDPATHKIYFDYGTETLDAMYEPFQLRIDTLMQHHGYDTLNWQTLKFQGDDHSENAWRKRFELPVTFLLGK